MMYDCVTIEYVLLEEMTMEETKRKLRLPGLLEILVALVAIAAGVWLILNAPSAEITAAPVDVPAAVTVRTAAELGDVPAVYTYTAAPGTIDAVPSASAGDETAPEVFTAPNHISAASASYDPGYASFGADFYTYSYKAGRNAVQSLDNISSQISSVNSNLAGVPRGLAAISSQIAYNIRLAERSAVAAEALNGTLVTTANSLMQNAAATPEGIAAISAQLDYSSRAVALLVDNQAQSVSAMSTSAGIAAQSASIVLEQNRLLAQLIRILYLGFGAFLVLGGAAFLCKARLYKA